MTLSCLKPPLPSCWPQECNCGPWLHSKDLIALPLQLISQLSSSMLVTLTYLCPWLWDSLFLPSGILCLPFLVISLRAAFLRCTLLSTLSTWPPYTGLSHHTIPVLFMTQYNFNLCFLILRKNNLKLNLNNINEHDSFGKIPQEILLCTQRNLN